MRATNAKNGRRLGAKQRVGSETTQAPLSVRSCRAKLLMALPAPLAFEAVPPQTDRFVAKVDAALKSRTSTFRRLSGYRTFMMTTSRITSGDDLK